MRRFLVRFLLAIAGGWIGGFLVPGVKTDREVTTFLLFGFLLAVGEVVLPVAEGAAAVVLFFLPRTVRNFLLRGIVVGVAAALTNGYGVAESPLVAIAGLTILLSLLYMVPFAN